MLYRICSGRSFCLYESDSEWTAVQKKWLDFKVQRLFGYRMQEIQAAGAKMEPAGRNPLGIVLAVSQNRASCMGKLDPDLMMPSRVQMNGQTG